MNWFRKKLTEKELVGLRIKAYEMARQIPAPLEYKETHSWLDFKSREIYNWLLTGKD